MSEMRAVDAINVVDARVSYQTKSGPVVAVSGVTVRIGSGEAVGIVGESGSGKSTLAAACIGMLSIPLLNRTPVTIEGSISILGQETTGLDERQWQGIRGCTVGYVGQDPFGALNPVLRIHHHMDEALRHFPRHERSERAAALLRSVELPVEVANAFPHELSGGMRQRVAIAMAVANRPALLVADEPTTALDVTTQAEILKLLARLRAETGMAVLLISHDLGVVSQVCERVYVMLRGTVVESGAVGTVLHHPEHAYTRALLTGARLERGADGRFRTGMDVERAAEAMSATPADDAAAQTEELLQ